MYYEDEIINNNDHNLSELMILNIVLHYKSLHYIYVNIFVQIQPW